MQRVNKTYKFPAMKQKRKSRARGEEDDISQQFYAARAGTENVIIITSLVFFPRVSAQCAGTPQQRSCTLKLEQCEPLLCIKHEHSWELNHDIWNSHTRLFKRFFWKINTQHPLLTYMHSPCPRRVMEHHIAARSAVRECPRHPHSADQDACQAPRHSGTMSIWEIQSCSWELGEIPFVHTRSAVSNQLTNMGINSLYGKSSIT